MFRLTVIAAAFVLVACGGANDASTPTERTEDMTAPVADMAPSPQVDPTGEPCGGISGVMCPSGFFCQQPEGQCLEVIDGTGSCQTVPQLCTQEYDPVCGCDGQTYGNACEAAAARASVAATGECAATDTL